METAILDAYANSSHRLFMLDYDGTLVGFKIHPEDAKPTPRVRSTLRALAGNPKNTVVIVSGRDHETLDAWLGDLPVAIVAEHGFFIRAKGGEWRKTTLASFEWKRAVRLIMESAVQQVPGSLIEEKASALVWHYIQANPTVAANVEVQLREQLRGISESAGLTIMPGSEILEVKPTDINKGVAARHWFSQNGWDFIFAAGDDTTDEDLFAAVPEGGFTVKVRPGKTIARSRLASDRELVDLLAKIAKRASK